MSTETETETEHSESISLGTQPPVRVILFRNLKQQRLLLDDAVWVPDLTKAAKERADPSERSATTPQTKTKTNHHLSY
jgi:hypothetical protein